MPNEGKPENAPVQPTESAGTGTQQTEQKPANPTVEMSDSVKSYLKGLGLEGVQATPELVKVAEAGMKQKESVSRKSQEVETLLARLASQGKDTSEPEPITSGEEQTTTPQTTPTQPQQPTETTGKIGVSDNDLFDLARMVTTDFKELSESAQDGSLFKELRQLGYFTSKGIDKKAVYDYLAGKNAAAQELRELREFKEKYSQPNPSANPIYNAAPGINMEGTMNHDLAHHIALQGPQSKRYQEAVAFLRKEVLDAK